MVEREPCALLVGMYIDSASMDNSIDVPQKIKNRAIVGSSNTTSGNTSEGNEITVLNRYLYTHGHCSVIHNSQDVETT